MFDSFQSSFLGARYYHIRIDDIMDTHIIPFFLCTPSDVKKRDGKK